LFYFINIDNSYPILQKSIQAAGWRGVFEHTIIAKLLIINSVNSSYSIKHMKRLAFKMKLFPGNIAEYKKRHDELWPELTELLYATGISDYSIFLDEESLDLFGVLRVEDEAAMDELPHHPVMKKWWAYMRDMMECNDDNSPISIPLKNVFYMP
jgi:L-rhamnose mutarotase